MDNFDLKLKEIFTSTMLTKSQKISHAEKMLTEKIGQETTNSELYFKLAVVVLEEPEVDFIKSIKCMKKILHYDKTNTEAAIFLSWLQYFHQGYIHPSTLILLDNLLENAEMDSLSTSLIYLVKSWSDEIDEQQHYYFLEQSVESNNQYVDNCLELSKCYRHKGEMDKERYFLLKALKNIEEIYLMDDLFNLAAAEPYLSDRFRGVINIPTYEVPEYNTLKRESILRTVIDSHTVSNILKILKASN
ncbi:hypothetical protein MKZ02_12195 [Pseudobacillus sp. FSL P4-0506]|uniref:hypothetical protein n=1 Tax=Pseudobacillus sp. FSL P4-0506 TaxID=2921576 RepID=UPI0030F968EB